jgi:hypothetical protein
VQQRGAELPDTTQGLEIVLYLLYHLVRLGSQRSSPLANGWGVLPSSA